MNRLWYIEAARKSDEALPLGNGSMWAMCFGGNIADRFRLGCGSFRGGNSSASDKSRKDSSALCPETFCDLFIIPEIPWDKSENLAERAYEMRPCDKYIRQLDIDHGIHSVFYYIDGASNLRESFISYPDRVFAVACKGAPFRATLGGGENIKADCTDGKTVFVKKYTDGGEYVFAARAIVGPADVRDGIIRCESGSVIIASCESTLNSESPVSDVLSRLDSAEKLGFDELRRRHTDDISHIMKKGRLIISGENADILPTDECINNAKRGAEDFGLVNVSFSYGRYLLASFYRSGLASADIYGLSDCAAGFILDSDTAQKAAAGRSADSAAWSAVVSAANGNGDLAWKQLRAFLAQSAPNLSGDNMPYCADENFAVTACIAEMLIRVREGKPELLPALPKAWLGGRARGLPVCSGAAADLDWKNGKLTKVVLKADEDCTLTIEGMGEVALNKGANEFTFPE